ILPFRPNTDSDCWSHATLMLWLLSQLRPQRCVGSGELFAMTRALAVQRRDITEFVVAPVQENCACDLLMLDAEAAGTATPARIVEQRSDARRHAGAILVVGVPADAWRTKVAGWQTTLIESRRNLGLLYRVPASDIAAPTAIPESSLRSLSTRCATIN